jgi:hypothetical protein
VKDKTSFSEAEREFFDRLRRYDQVRGGGDFVKLMTGFFPLDFSLYVERADASLAVGKCRLELFGLFCLLVDGGKVASSDASPGMLDRMMARLKARPEDVLDVLVAVSFMVQHAPAKLDAAVNELLLEAEEFAAGRGSRGGKGRPATRLPRRVRVSRAVEEKRIRARLAHDDLESRVLAAVRLGFLTKEAVAGQVGRDARTLQRWAKSRGGWKAVIGRLQGDNFKQ